MACDLHPIFRRRGAGVLLHPTSLPGPPFGGDLGPGAHAFLAWLQTAGQSWWQMLPVSPVGPGGSPYGGTSALAGDPLLVSLEALAERGLLAPGELPRASRRPARSDRAGAQRTRAPLLRRAFERWRERRGSERRGFRSFRAAAREWLADHALFSALHAAQGGRPWTSWPAGLRDRRPDALRAARAELAEELLYHEFLQYAFARQWRALRRAAARRGVRLLGDLPLFVVHDSADVWAHRELFRLERDGRPSVVSGVPPDEFSASGQLWGHPHYRWKRHEQGGFRWWRLRFQVALERFDALRIDHFIGFERAWEVPARARSARRGRWGRAAGRRLLEVLARERGPLPLVAEDLGAVTAGVRRLREDFALPGMRVLHFAFGPQGGWHRPHNHPVNAVVYSATHDNDTSRGWFRKAPRDERRRALLYSGGSARTIHRDFLRLAYSSPAHTAIAPAQDLLGLGSKARMNTPGTTRGNWCWRLAPDALDASLARELEALTLTFERDPRR